MQQLLHYLSEHYGDLLLTALFVHFQKMSLSNLESANPVVDDVNRCISSIIESRVKKTKETTREAPMRLSDLPPALIGASASFLVARDYSNYEASCRSIYLGWSSPSMLQSLDVHYLN